MSIQHDVAQMRGHLLDGHTDTQQLLNARQMDARRLILRQLPKEPALQFDLPLDTVNGLERGLRIRGLASLVQDGHAHLVDDLELLDDVEGLGLLLLDALLRHGTHSGCMGLLVALLSRALCSGEQLGKVVRTVTLERGHRRAESNRNVTIRFVCSQAFVERGALRM
jgi:hypothetical protein